jgi:tetratricopeptide (TPR) repeat protein
MFRRCYLPLLLLMLSSFLARAADDDLAQGRQALEKRDYDAAIRRFDAVLKSQPENGAAYYERGRAHLGKVDLDLAIRDFSEALRLNPKSSESHCWRAYAYERKQDFGPAFQDFEQAVRLNPNYLDAYFGRGELFRGIGTIAAANQDFCWEQAILNYNKVLRIDPKNVSALVSRADCQVRKGNEKDALEDLSRAIEIDPKNFRPYQERALIDAGKRDYAGAIKEIDEAIRLNPSSSEAFAYRAGFSMALERYEAAARDYATALRIDPHNLTASQRFAHLLATCPKSEVRDGKAAIDYAKKSCDITQWKDCTCMQTLAAAYAEAGNFKEAIDLQKKALKVIETVEGAVEGKEPLKFDDKGNVIRSREIRKAEERLRLYEAGKPYREK